MRSMSGGYSTRVSAEREFSYWKLDDPEAHPLNEKIYGTEVLDEDFVKSIADHGILTPIVIARLALGLDPELERDPNAPNNVYRNYVLSGHRRFPKPQTHIASTKNMTYSFGGGPSFWRDAT